MNARSIDLTIEHLVLHGFAPADRARIGAAVERELARLVGERGLPAAWRDGAERLQGGSFAPTPGERPEVAGARIAAAVYGGPTP